MKIENLFIRRTNFPRLLMLSFSFTYCNILTSIHFISTFRKKIWEYLQIQTSMEQWVIALGYSNAENKKG